MAKYQKKTIKPLRLYSNTRKVIAAFLIVAAIPLWYLMTVLLLYLYPLLLKFLEFFRGTNFGKELVMLLHQVR